MTIEELQEILSQGETESVEFKRCGNKPGSDTFESICAFANGFGGAVYLGVADDGRIRGIESSDVLSVTRNIHNTLNNPNAFDIPVAVEFEHLELDGRQVVKVSVPSSPQVHSYKGKVYERRGDSDVILRGSAPLAELCIRKQGIFTERRIIEHVAMEDFRQDLIDEARKLAVAKRKDHPWRKMTNAELMESAGFRAKDYSTGAAGFTLGAVVALGKDEVIRAVCPTYKTDAVVRVVDADKYDDRIVVTTNLMSAYEQLAEFGRKHLPDRFTTDGDRAVSARDIILRELLVNCLVHREFTSPFPAKFIIDSEGIRTENASRASFEGPLNPNAFAPLPKNPTIASFFSHIGLAEEMGSGTRELYRWSRVYSGNDPQLEEGIVFRALIPTAPRAADVRNEADRGKEEGPIGRFALQLATRPEGLKAKDLVGPGVSQRTAQRVVRNLVDEGQLRAEGAGRSRVYRSAASSQ